MNTVNTSVDLWVCTNGNKLAEFSKDGRFYVEGREGTEFSLKLRNNNPFRVKVVVSVDGVSVISGKPAGESDSEAGYVLGAHETTDIRGYRLDNDNVAAFRFTKAEKGYAQADKGMSGTTGVIGVRVFKEKTVPAPAPVVVKEVHHHHHDDWIYNGTPWWPYRRSFPYYGSPYYGVASGMSSPIGQAGGNESAIFCCSNSSTSSLGAQASTFTSCSLKGSVANDSLMRSVSSPSIEENPFTLGATFGSKTESKVREISFASECCLGVLELYYTTRDGLIALGIDLTKTQKVAFPTAFSNQYATPPSGWSG